MFANVKADVRALCRTGCLVQISTYDGGKILDFIEANNGNSTPY